VIDPSEARKILGGEHGAACWGHIGLANTKAACRQPFGFLRRSSDQATACAFCFLRQPTHPMGYSDMQFGYWTRPPSARADFIAVKPKRP
jgi:hypothetical protein